MEFEALEGSETIVNFEYLVLGAGAAEVVNLGDILATLVIFFVLMALLKKFAWGPLMGIMKQREELVASEIDAAENARKEAAKALEEQKALLKEARTEAQKIIESAKKQAEAQRDEIVETARQEANRLKESAVREIETEKEKAIASLREEVVSLSVLAASKVLEKEISEEDNSALIKETIAKAGEAK
ncbi:F0F1 ATP synthase subunit B [Ureibacillus thermosphaericus]|uniref:F0F1 ATP synthase subunit B n=1 Tax=Ureibacillus thermosphaericus TaxID=51173 RepID=UPI003BF477B8